MMVAMDQRKSKQVVGSVIDAYKMERAKDYAVDKKFFENSE